MKHRLHGTTTRGLENIERASFASGDYYRASTTFLLFPKLSSKRCVSPLVGPAGAVLCATQPALTCCNKRRPIMTISTTIVSGVPDKRTHGVDRCRHARGRYRTALRSKSSLRATSARTRAASYPLSNDEI